MFDVWHYMNSVGNKPASLLVVPLGKAQLREGNFRVQLGANIEQCDRPQLCFSIEFIQWNKIEPFLHQWLTALQNSFNTICIHLQMMLIVACTTLRV